MNAREMSDEYGVKFMCDNCHREYETYGEAEDCCK